MKLKNRNRKPPPGWVYRQKETGWEFKGDMRGDAVLAIKNHRIANKLDRTELAQIEDDLDEFICGTMRGHWAIFDLCVTCLKRPLRGKQPVPKVMVFNFNPKARSSRGPTARPAPRPAKTSDAVKAYVAEIQKESSSVKKRTISCCGRGSKVKGRSADPVGVAGQRSKTSDADPGGEPGGDLRQVSNESADSMVGAGEVGGGKDNRRPGKSKNRSKAGHKA